MGSRQLCAALAVASAILVGLPAAASAGDRIFGVTAGTPRAVSFDSADPGTFLTDVPVTRVGGGEGLIGLDTRPATGAPLLLTRDASGVGRLYTLDPFTRAATLIAALSADPADSTAPYTTLPSASFGFDVNPVPDRIRVTASEGTNLRVNPVNALVTTDTPTGRFLVAAA